MAPDFRYRKEKSGLHCYDRTRGLHILFDELEFQSCDRIYSPRTVSLAITTACDLHCPYCHIDKRGARSFSSETIAKLVRILDAVGTFDVAIGGGEPTLHPQFAEICRDIWSNTRLGLTVTTHGLHLTPSLAKQIQQYVSLVRISIDGTNDIYLQNRGTPFNLLVERAEQFKDIVPLGVNVVINADTINDLDSVLQFAIHLKARELLILPQISNGTVSLPAAILEKLESWIKEHYEVIPMRILTPAKSLLDLPFLFPNDEYERSYAYVSPDWSIRADSYTSERVYFSSPEQFEAIISTWDRSRCA